MLVIEMEGKERCMHACMHKAKKNPRYIYYILYLFDEPKETRICDTWKNFFTLSHVDSVPFNKLTFFSHISYFFILRLFIIILRLILIIIL